MSTNEPPISRFNRKTRYNPQNGCIEWTACKDKDGYGLFRINGIQHRAHRAIYFLLLGSPLPSNFIVCHKCDNPSCVNVNHHFIGDHSMNVKDSVAKGRQKEIRKTHCPQGHPFSGENLYIVAKTGKRQCKICRKVATDKGNAKKKAIHEI